MVVVPAAIVGGGLYLFKHCMDKCQGGTLCPEEQKSRSRYGSCAGYCFSLSSMLMTILDGGFLNTKPPTPSPTSTAETIGAAVGAAASGNGDGGNQ